LLKSLLLPTPFSYSLASTHPGYTENKLDFQGFSAAIDLRPSCFESTVPAGSSKRVFVLAAMKACQSGGVSLKTSNAFYGF